MQTENQGNDNNAGRERRRQVFRTYLPMALLVFGIIVVSMIVFFLIFRYEGTGTGVKNIIRALQAVFIGCGIAYLINPLVKFFEKHRLDRLRKENREISTAMRRRIRIGSVAGAMVIFIAIIAAIIILIIPQVVSGVTDFVQNINENLSAIQGWVDNIAKQRPQLAEQLGKYYEEGVEYLRKWFTERFLSNGTFIKSVTSSIYNVIRTLFNTLIGLVVAIYVLMKKEVFKGLIKKIVYAVFKPRIGNYVMEVLRKTDDVFGGFFIGDIVDSLIIGVICFFGLLVLRIPYAGLIGLIVGVTNLIPIFGPYFGAIPSALLIVLVDPWKALIFIIFIIILQQFDGNILKPRILGDTLGLSPFWIIFAIVLFGGLFGIWGFLIGVPSFAVLYYVIKRIVEFLLRRQKLPVETGSYVNIQRIDSVNEEVKMRESPKEDRQILHFGKKARKSSRQEKESDRGE